MGKIYEYLRGSYTVTARAESVCRALNVLMKNNVPFYGVKAEGGGLVGFCLEQLFKLVIFVVRRAIRNAKTHRN